MIDQSNKKLRAEHKIIKQRSCIGCRTVRHKSELIRCVKNPSGKIMIDPDGKAQGRGAYMCRNRECFAKVKKKRLFNRAFKTVVDENFYDELEKMLPPLNTDETQRANGTS